MRDSKGRFKSKGLIITIPNAAVILNFLVIIFVLIPWLYVGFRFSLMERLFELVGSLFGDNGKCNCQNEENKY